MKKTLLIIASALLLSFVAGCQNETALEDLEIMKTQAVVEAQNQEIARKFVEALDEGKFDIHEELFSEDYVCHFAGNPELLSRETQKQYIQVYYEAFPNNKHFNNGYICQE